MDFDGIAGQERIIKNLKNSVNNESFVHAYLFCGPEGVGKEKTARFFACALLCSSAENKPCGACSSCKKINAGNHPDLIEVKSDKPSIGVDAIRQLNSHINIKPYMGDKKVYIIYDCWKMTVQAQNSLLKNLEEPPEYGVIILLSDSSDSLLPTIVSRSHVLKFSKVGSRDMEEILCHRFKRDNNEIKFAVSISEGIMGRAVGFLTSHAFTGKRETLINVICRLLEEGESDFLDLIDYFLKCKTEIDSILDLFELWLRDIMVLIYTDNRDLVVNADKLDLIRKHANLWTAKGIKYILGIVQRTRRMINSNVNYKLAVETMILDILEVERNDNCCRNSV